MQNPVKSDESTTAAKTAAAESPAAGQVRSARPADMEAVQRLVNDFAGEEMMLHRSMQELYENVREFVVYEENGRIGGCASLDIVWGDLAEIKSLAVDSSLQKQGIGRLVVEACLDQARRLGIPQVYALTFQVDFFTRIGFRHIPKAEIPRNVWGECIRCPKFPNCDEQAVWIDLDAGA